MEILGWCATILVAVSFLFKNIVTLRLVNSLSCMLWLVYGFFLHSYPVITVNVIILIIQGYWLIKIWLDNKDKGTDIIVG